MSSPLLLADFLTHALDQGGFEGMLALNSIFTLVTRHGLEYPAFYARLYGLIAAEAFTNKHRWGGVGFVVLEGRLICGERQGRMSMYGEVPRRAVSDCDYDVC